MLTSDKILTLQECLQEAEQTSFEHPLPPPVKDSGLRSHTAPKLGVSGGTKNKNRPKLRHALKKALSWIGKRIKH